MFLKVFQYFGKSHRKRSPSSKIAPKHSPNTTKMLPRASREPSKRPQDPSKSPFGISWPLLGHSEASKKLQNSPKSINNFRNVSSSSLLGCSWALFWHSRAFLGRYWGLMGALWLLLERSWAALGQLLGDLWRSLRAPSVILANFLINPSNEN